MSRRKLWATLRWLAVMAVSIVITQLGVQAGIAPARAGQDLATLCEWTNEFSDSQARDAFDAQCADISARIEGMSYVLGLNALVLVVAGLLLLSLSIVQLFYIRRL